MLKTKVALHNSVCRNSAVAKKDMVGITMRVEYVRRDRGKTSVSAGCGKGDSYVWSGSAFGVQETVIAGYAVFHPDQPP